MTQAIKTIHIYTGHTFMGNSDRFEGNLFENTIVIFSKERKEYKPGKKIIQLNGSKKDIEKVIGICQKAELVVLYDLDQVKIKIALSLPNHIKIAWRFFGHELYDRQRLKYLSKTTQRTLGVKLILEKFWEKKNITQFTKALNRINFFLGLSEAEYHLLVNNWRRLPKFIQLSFPSLDLNPSSINFKLKINEPSPLILIGNSMAMYNNHIDIIKLIEQQPNRQQFNFTLLFNYGLEKYYTKKIRKLTRGKNYFHLIEDFMSLDEFNSLYERTSALVVNSHRQMAMGNIFTAFKKGVKVYLNEKNLMLHWLKKEGFRVFSIKNFQNDLQNNNASLTQNLAINNFQQLKKLSGKYSDEKFQENLYAECTLNKK
ncbi:hypothetical protein SAMN05444280_1285 [Tangfeifania diversioriginum]|uniref:4-alpha-L-fucosyltransferase glycosyl transferase group 56 n=1 Tax=Tangfeifania diversioriginum TaxID=1168035 RepID=A0A1M6LRQ8_9BACT|nr:hypothetical protein [Tangfeifania diversioriginum]SHJ73845.1 hypothetical protein SAMN05444280_1285 [Tangfeifania diversioriginum]